MNLQRINNERFSIRLVRICQDLNLKTVHSAIKFFSNCSPHVKIGGSPYGTRVTFLLRELKAYDEQ